MWLTASQLLGQLFAAHQPEQLVAVWRGEGGETSTQSSATTFITNRLDKKVRQNHLYDLILLLFVFLTNLQSSSFRYESWRYLCATSYSPGSLTQRQESRCPDFTKTQFKLKKITVDLIDKTVSLPQQVIKNLLFVGKVIYLVSPESDVTSTQEEGKEEEEERDNGHEEEIEEDNDEEEEGERENRHEEEEEEEKENDEEEEDDKDDRPPSLLWLMKKLLLMAKREAAYSPKVPLKVLHYMSTSLYPISET